MSDKTPGTPRSTPRLYGVCVGCGARCDVTEYFACADCLADPDKTLVAAARLRTLHYWFDRFGTPTIH
jgi:hypothetical protein